MFLEKCGKFFFLKMRPSFFFILTLFPLLGAALFLFSIGSKLQNLEERFRAAMRKEKFALERKMRKERFLARYSDVDPYFLGREIESFQPLKEEKKRLVSRQHHPAYPESSSITERLKLIHENKLAFIEEKISIESQMKETEERQRYSVQMDESDLKELLSLIEDIPSEAIALKRPQILIKDFRMKKLETSLQTETFEVKMDLLKREFIP